MDSCTGVEQDLDKALTKFNSLNDHTNRVLQDIIDQVEELRKEIAKQPENTPLSPAQAMVVSDLASSVKQTVFQMSTEHRELHATVSRVGKSIDRHFIADYASVAPKAESFCNDTNRPIMEQAIAQHLYRQGLEDVGDTFVEEAKVTGVERTCTFALLQRCAAALSEGDPSAALHWTERRAHELHNSPLPFTLHRMQAFKLAREQGVGAAIAYARRCFPAHAARHERALQAAVCALAWCTPGAGPAPDIYQHLLDPKALGTYTALAAGRRVRARLVHAGRRPRARHLPAPARPQGARYVHSTRCRPPCARSPGARRAPAPRPTSTSTCSTPRRSVRTQHSLQAAVCALAWCTPGAGPAPDIYQHLLDPKALGTYTALAAGRRVRARLVHAGRRPRARHLPAPARPQGARYVHSTRCRPPCARSPGARRAPAPRPTSTSTCSTPRRSVRTQHSLQAAVCALAWCTPGAGPAPDIYQHLLDPKALGAEAAELFIKEACALLRLAPLSPLAGGVLAGARVLPALHDIRAKMTHPHVIAAWSDDELPFEVDLGEDGGGYHSVFACPILRQQASEQNPPMRLLCGHVISRDALNKLAMGAKLKCPYCPMEQSPAEARQIYFS
ncbi:E3 ubiquitin-protein transferase RMND5B isoform X1 [Helicoverpa zea]|uniref:E3 ubiquitin-protein transferase RMND5B isoform X1 n=1 Tax=Helicoverpa zea TaxID=7113 RepID=UPI001F575CD2|nr:E3 ubiquitin-protein transferase RMND5B isoform X1 [Helicoverpa zea]